MYKDERDRAYLFYFRDEKSNRSLGHYFKIY